MMRPSGRRIVFFGIATVLAAVLLYYSVRGIEWGQVAHVVAGASVGGLLLTAAIATVNLLLRAYRWRLLLNAEGNVSIPTAFWATTAGYFGNNFLPARGGELVRTFMISAGSGLETAYVLATALSERAVDAVTLVIIGAGVLLMLPNPPGWLAGVARPSAVVALIAVGGIALLPLLRNVGARAIGRAPFPHAVRPKLIATMDHALRGMRAFHDGRRICGFVALTAVIWCLDATGTMVVAAALGLTMPVPAAFLLIAGLGLGSALPSTPGYVGIYQFVAVTVLAPFGYTRADAIAFILVAQALSYVVIGFWGLLGIARYRRERIPTQRDGPAGPGAESFRERTRTDRRLT
jgi:glycosyltransferase 2 family protein